MKMPTHKHTYKNTHKHTYTNQPGGLPNNLFLLPENVDLFTHVTSDLDYVGKVQRGVGEAMEKRGKEKSELRGLNEKLAGFIEKVRQKDELSILIFLFRIFVLKLLFRVFVLKLLFRVFVLNFLFRIFVLKLLFRILVLKLLFRIFFLKLLFRIFVLKLLFRIFV